MEDIEQECKEALSIRGAVVDSLELKNNWRQLYDFCSCIEIEINAPSRFEVAVPLVYVRVLNSKKIGACIVKHNSKFFIGINLASYYVLKGLFSRMCASPKLFTRVGDPTREIDVEKVFNFEITDMDEYELRVYDEVIPKDQIRRELVNTLLIHSLNFLIYHELGHALLGHLDFKIAVSGQNAFEEATPNKSQVANIENELSQFMELDADRFASWENLKNIDRKIFQWEGSNESIIFQLANDICMWAYSVYSLCKLFGKYEPNAANLIDSTHPSPGTKQINSAGVITAFYEFKNDKKNLFYLHWKTAFFLVNGAFKDVDKAFSEISEIDYNDDFIMYKNHLMNHYQLIYQAFPKANLLLKPFAIIRRN